MARHTRQRASAPTRHTRHGASIRAIRAIRANAPYASSRAKARHHAPRRAINGVLELESLLSALLKLYAYIRNLDPIDVS